MSYLLHNQWGESSAFLFIKILEWIPKWQNKIDAWFSVRLFSKLIRKVLILNIGYNEKYGSDKRTNNSKSNVYKWIKIDTKLSHRSL